MKTVAEIADEIRNRLPDSANVDPRGILGQFITSIAVELWEQQRQIEYLAEHLLEVVNQIARLTNPVQQINVPSLEQLSEKDLEKFKAQWEQVTEKEGAPWRTIKTFEDQASELDKLAEQLTPEGQAKNESRRIRRLTAPWRTDDGSDDGLL